MDPPDYPPLGAPTDDPRLGWEIAVDALEPAVDEGATVTVTLPLPGGSIPE